MRTFQAISTFLFLLAIGFFLCDLVWQYALHGQFKFLSIEELWTDIYQPSYESAKAMAEPYVPASTVDLFVHLPAATVLLAIGIIFYLPFRLLSLLGVGRKETR